MEYARKVRPEYEAEDAMRGRGPERARESFDKVLRFAPPQGREAETEPAREPGREPARERQPGLSARDITHALDLVREAAQNIHSAEERARDGETRLQTLLIRATEEMKNAEARIEAAEAKARAAEARAQEADLRARDAESWLRQIFSTISDELPQRR